MASSASTSLKATPALTDRLASGATLLVTMGCGEMPPASGSDPR